MTDSTYHSVFPFPLPLHELPSDPIYGLFEDFKNCPHPHKLNMAIGIVPDITAPSRPYLFSAVQKAYLSLLHNSSPNFAYTPLTGNKQLLDSVKSLIGLEYITERVASIQSVGGTGALSTLGHLYHLHGMRRISFGSPSWPNHTKIFQRLGFEISNWNWLTPSGVLDVESFQKHCDGSSKDIPQIFLFHLSCHNPTGVDPTSCEWDRFLTTIQKVSPQSHVIFDVAYLGFQGTSLYDELYPIRKAIELHMSFSIAFSCSKTLGLYSERVGIAYFVGEKSHRNAIESHMSEIQRAIYSSPPKFGSLIAERVFCQKNRDLFQEWKNEIKTLSLSFKKTREELYNQFISNGLTAQVSLKKGSGLFTVIDILSSEKIEQLRQDHAIFLTHDGRINIACLQEKVLQDQFFHALKNVLTSPKKTAPETLLQ